ncbi:MAG: ATP-binding protein [Planctomycetota bacterium]
MQELALHILDLVENAIRAGATVIAVTIEEQYTANTLTITIEDNGPGINVSFERAADPFYTTKGKKTGLGLGLFRNAAEMMGGGMTIDRSTLGGARVTGHFRLRHINRRPMGDLAATIAGVVCTSPGLDLRLRLIAGGVEYAFTVADVRAACGRVIDQKIHKGLSVLDTVTV